MAERYHRVVLSDDQRRWLLDLLTMLEADVPTDDARAVVRGLALAVDDAAETWAA